MVFPQVLRKIHTAKDCYIEMMTCVILELGVIWQVVLFPTWVLVEDECVFCSGSRLGRIASIEIQYSKANQSNTRFWASYPFPNVKSIPNNFHRDVDYENDLIWICPCSWAFLFLGFSCFLEQHKRKETPSLLCIILPNKFKAEI